LGHGATFLFDIKVNVNVNSISDKEESRSLLFR